MTDVTGPLEIGKGPLEGDTAACLDAGLAVGGHTAQGAWGEDASFQRAEARVGAEGACILLVRVLARLGSAAMVKENTSSCTSCPLSVLMILVLDQDIKLVQILYRFVSL